MDKFVDELHELYDRLEPALGMNTPMEKVDEATMLSLQADPNCCICSRKLGKTKHLDHCHYTVKLVMHH